jgi:acyl-CoA synthetase (AMP-forming)/AMP-acid ligase II
MLLMDVLRLRAAKFPADPAVTLGEHTVDFQTLLKRSLALSRGIRRVTEPGDRVAILAENLTEYLECYYGVPQAGAILVILNFRLHLHEWVHMLRDCGATTIIGQDKYLDAIRDVLGELPDVKTIIAIGPNPAGAATPYESLLVPDDGAAPLPVREDDPAWLLYTSGTTSRPKGAVLSHRNVITAAVSGVLEFQPEHRTQQLMAFPLCHVSASYTLLMAHLQGTHVVLMPTYEPRHWMELVQRHRITSSGLAPTMIATLLSREDRHEFDLSSMRFLMYATSTISEQLLTEAIGFFGPILCAGYGMTEAGGGVMCFPKSAHVRAVSGEPRLLRGTGRSQPLVSVRLVDSAGGDVQPGAVGEIWIRGEQVFLGYWNNQSATDEAVTSDGWLRSGDLAYQDKEGFYFIVDRIKDMIITGGENVYSREVEEVIRTVAGVHDVAVVGLPDEIWGERVTAVIVPSDPQRPPAPDGIIAACRQELGRYKVPKQVEFTAGLPLNTVGKVAKKELRQRLIDAAG